MTLRIVTTFLLFSCSSQPAPPHQPLSVPPPPVVHSAAPGATTPAGSQAAAFWCLPLHSDRPGDALCHMSQQECEAFRRRQLRRGYDLAPCQPWAATAWCLTSCDTDLCTPRCYTEQARCEQASDDGRCDASPPPPLPFQPVGSFWWCYTVTRTVGADHASLGECYRRRESCETFAAKWTGSGVSTSSCSERARAACMVYEYRMQDAYGLRCSPSTAQCKSDEKQYAANPDTPVVSACALWD
jgi:hypothetical protein